MGIRCAELQGALKDCVNKRKAERIAQMTIKKSEAWRGVAFGILQKVLKGKLSRRGNDSSATKATTAASTLRLGGNAAAEETLRKYEDGDQSPQHRDETDATIARLEEELETLRAGMREAKQAEMTRISREFIAKNYEQRFGVSRRRVIAALIGEEGACFENGRQLKERDEYIRENMRRSTFYFGTKVLVEKT